MAKIDTNTNTWLAVADWADDCLKKARAKLESDATDHEQVLVCRAQIKLLKQLLELPSKAPQPTETGVAFGIDPP